MRLSRNGRFAEMMKDYVGVLALNEYASYVGYLVDLEIEDGWKMLVGHVCCAEKCVVVVGRRHGSK